MGERFVTTNGIRVYAVEEGRGPLVLLVHGFPECWWSWRRQLPELAEAGYRAVAVDLPGYGRSDKPDVTYDEQWLNACLAGVVTGLGAERCVIVGHDWGGLLVWPFARRYPELLAGVVGVNTPDLPRPPMAPTALLRMAFPDEPPYLVQFQDRGPAEYLLGRDVRAFFEAMLHGPATRRQEVFGDDEIDRYVEQFAPFGAFTPPLEYYRNLDRNWELSADLPAKVDVPALMVSAADDPVLTPAMADGMEARVPDLRRTIIEDCGHWTQQEQPEAFRAALLGFLDELPPWR
jgi:pimeloyl-ACP methyl ester carboxylesterase